MAKRVIHISETDAASDFASLLDRVRDGAEVIIERDARPVAVVRPPEALRGRLLSESIALAEAHAKELGHAQPTCARSLIAASRVTSLHGSHSRFQRPHRSRTWR
jgi:antitoxin (DNA-binding transcriptional repressor) of toxin-antitoxin stability system